MIDMKLILLSSLMVVMVTAAVKTTKQCVLTAKWQYPKPGGTIYEIHGFEITTNAKGTGPFKAYVGGVGTSKKECLVVKAGTKDTSKHRYLCNKPILGKYIVLEAMNGGHMALCYLGLVGQMPPKTTPKPTPKKPAGLKTCRDTVRGLEYQGTRAVTKTGKTCLTWATHPTKKFLPKGDEAKFFPEKNLKAAKNYCRNGDNDRRGPWCYINNKGTYEFCDIPKCDTGCVTNVRGLKYRGTKSVTNSGKQCLPWATHPTKRHLPKGNNAKFFPEKNLQKADNYCRNGDNDRRGPWCYIDRKGNYEFCGIPTCTKNKLCRSTTAGLEYTGTVSETKTGKACLTWATHPTKRLLPKGHEAKFFPEDNLADAKNYCRNGDNDKRGPWCYINKKGDWEFCKIPMCK